MNPINEIISEDFQVLEKRMTYPNYMNTIDIYSSSEIIACSKIKEVGKFGGLIGFCFI